MSNEFEMTPVLKVVFFNLLWMVPMSWGVFMAVVNVAKLFQ